MLSKSVPLQIPKNTSPLIYALTLSLCLPHSQRKWEEGDNIPASDLQKWSIYAEDANIPPQLIVPMLVNWAKISVKSHFSMRMVTLLCLFQWDLLCIFFEYSNPIALSRAAMCAAVSFIHYPFRLPPLNLLS
jgi:hypothetical protein